MRVMSPHRIKLADVAAAAGLSTSTASLVLSGRGDEMRIAKATQDRARQAAEELGYRRNAVSVGLRKGTTSTLALISDTVSTSPFAGDMIRGALDAARDAGFMLFIVETGGDPDEEARTTAALLDHRVDGIAFASVSTLSRPRPAADHDVPVVLLNSLPDDGAWGVAAVVPDEVGAGRTAARRLLDAGHRRIHLVGTGHGDDFPFGSVAAVERRAGIVEVLAGSGVSLMSQHGSPDWEVEDGFRIAQRLLELGVQGEAVIAMNDRLALGVQQAFREVGLSVPQDLSIVSFDDERVARQMRPGLTTLALPYYELGHLAVTLLIRAVRAGADAGATAGEGEPEPAPACEVHRLRMPLRERGTVASTY